MLIVLMFTLVLSLNIVIKADTEVCEVTLSPKSTTVASGETIDIKSIY